MDEHTQIRAAKKGDHDAFLALLRRYDRRIMAVIYRFSANLYDREDLYQEIFLHCFKSISRFRGDSSFETWLYRLAFNRCISYMKKNPDYEPLEGEQSPEESNQEDRLRVLAVFRALKELKGPQRICFHLHYIEDWPFSKIADVLQCREGTVKSHLFRAREKVKRNREVLAWIQS